MPQKFKILLTGKNGQLARTIISDLQKEYIIKSYCKKKLDITDKKNLEKIILKNKPTILINTAAYNNVENSERNKRLANQTNFIAVKYLKKICDQNNIFLIHFSTDYVFDGKKKAPYNEECLINPINEYGKSKAKGEKFLLNSVNKNFLIVRLSWVYSKYGINFYTKILKLLKKKRLIYVVNDQYGIPTSTKFIVFYLNKILKKIIMKEKLSNIYHLTPNGKTSWYNFSILILNSLNKNRKKVIDKNIILPCNSNFYDRAIRPVNSVLNSENIQKKIKKKFKNWEYYFYKEFKKK